MNRQAMWAVLALALCASACDNNDPEPARNNTTGTNNTNNTNLDMGMSGPDLPDIQADYRVPRRPALVWKRHRAFMRDLGRALELAPDALCKELGVADCGAVHHVALGGNDPIQVGMYRPVGEPLSTTPASIDRIVLSGCVQAVARDRAGSPVVFTAIDLEASALDVSDATTREAVRAQLTILYRRVLSRDPQEAELVKLEALTRDPQGQPVAAADFAALSCFAIATTTEALFY